VVIDDAELKDFVGQPPFSSDRIYDRTPAGVVMGLAWRAPARPAARDCCCAAQRCCGRLRSIVCHSNQALAAALCVNSAAGLCRWGVAARARTATDVLQSLPGGLHEALPARRRALKGSWARQDGDGRQLAVHRGRVRGARRGQGRDDHHRCAGRARLPAAPARSARAGCVEVLQLPSCCRRGCQLGQSCPLPPLSCARSP